MGQNPTEMNIAGKAMHTLQCTGERLRCQKIAGEALTDIAFEKV